LKGRKWEGEGQKGGTVEESRWERGRLKGRKVGRRKR
jgi:hypothetical protein